MFKLAMIQMLVQGGCREANLAAAKVLINQAAEQGASVAVLPEAMSLGWTHPSAIEHAEPIPNGPTCVALAQAARQHRLYICAGLVERDRQQVFNTAVLVDPNGEIILRHRKLNELDIGHEFYALGDRLGVARTPFGVIGVMICADAFAKGQVISRALGYMGADIILSPCSWAVPSDHDNSKEPYGKLWLDNYSPVARDFRLWIAGISNVGWITAGPWQGRKCIGCSLVVGPDGQKALMGPYGVEAEMVFYVDINIVPRPAQGTGWIGFWEKRRHGTESH